MSHEIAVVVALAIERFGWTGCAREVLSLINGTKLNDFAHACQLVDMLGNKRLETAALGVAQAVGAAFVRKFGEQPTKAKDKVCSSCAKLILHNLACEDQRAGLVKACNGQRAAQLVPVLEAFGNVDGQPSKHHFFRAVASAAIASAGVNFQTQMEKDAVAMANQATQPYEYHYRCQRPLRGSSRITPELAARLSQAVLSSQVTASMSGALIDAFNGHNLATLMAAVEAFPKQTSPGYVPLVQSAVDAFARSPRSCRPQVASTSGEVDFNVTEKHVQWLADVVLTQPSCAPLLDSFLSACRTKSWSGDLAATLVARAFMNQRSARMR